MKRGVCSKKFLKIYVVLMLVLTGCSHEASKSIAIELHTATDLNPDINGKSSPLVVALYQLKDTVKFEQADYFALYGNASQTLGQSLINKDEIELRPGENLTLALRLTDDIKYLGIMAAFRDVSHARWKKLIDLQENSMDDLQLFLQRSDIKVKF